MTNKIVLSYKYQTKLDNENWSFSILHNDPWQIAVITIVDYTFQWNNNKRKELYAEPWSFDVCPSDI